MMIDHNLSLFNGEVLHCPAKPLASIPYIA